MISKLPLSIQGSFGAAARDDAFALCLAVVFLLRARFHRVCNMHRPNPNYIPARSVQEILYKDFTSKDST